MSAPSQVQLRFAQAAARTPGAAGITLGPAESLTLGDAADWLAKANARLESIFEDYKGERAELRQLRSDLAAFRRIINPPAGGTEV